MKLTSILLGLTLGNFLYQALAGHLWLLAAEHSFFQAIAIFAVWLREKK